jgi:hypothetical protein
MVLPPIPSSRADRGISQLLTHRGTLLSTSSALSAPWATPGALTLAGRRLGSATLRPLPCQRVRRRCDDQRCWSAGVAELGRWGGRGGGGHAGRP